MISSLNGMLDELDCMKRIITIKTTLIEFPGKIISTKEINDIRLYFKDFERKIESYFRSFLAEKEKEAKSKKPKTAEMKERFKEIEALFDKVKTTEKLILSKASFLFDEYSRRENELLSGQIIPRKIKVVLNDGRSNNTANANANANSTNTNNANNANNANANNANNNANNNNNNNNNSQNATENSVPPEQVKDEYLIIDKIFLNTKVSINDVDLLKKRNTLDEEKNFITHLFNLKELFENSQSKQLIMLDYYMNLYNLCIDNTFTLQQISTIMSIFYYIFSYSFCWVSTEEKILEIYKSILAYHSLNNPPFSYEIFKKNQKKLLIDFFENTFIKNFAFFEVLFRYDVSVCFFNQVITREANVSSNNISQKKVDTTNRNNEKIMEESENMEEEEVKEKEGEKSLDEINDEKEIEMMKNFVNSFYQAIGDLEMQKAKQEGNILKGKNAEEANQARLFLDIKVPEIKKDINEQIEVQTRSVIKPVEQEMAEKAATKGGKK